jgi:hypothetical protein
LTPPLSKMRMVLEGYTTPRTSTCFPDRG